MKLVLLLAVGAFAAQDVTPPVISLTFADWIGTQDATNADGTRHASGVLHAWDSANNIGTQHSLPGWYTQEMGDRNDDEQVTKRASVSCVVNKDNTAVTATSFDACPDPSCTATDHHDDSVVCDEPRVIQISKSARTNGNHALAYSEGGEHWHAGTADYAAWGDDRIATDPRNNKSQMDSCTASASQTCVPRSELGQYLVTYTASDTSGNKAEPIAFTFIFIDPIVPQFSFDPADDSQAHGAVGYSDAMKTWPAHFTVTTGAGDAVWDAADHPATATKNTWGNIISSHSTTDSSAAIAAATTLEELHVYPTLGITTWGTTATAASDITDYSEFGYDSTTTHKAAKANVEAGNCDKLFGGAQNALTGGEDVDAQCSRGSSNGNWLSYDLDVTASDNYRASAQIKVYTRVSLGSTLLTSWTPLTTSNTATLCMDHGNVYTIDWYADDEAGIFGWKHKSNPQSHRVQIKVTDNTRPTIHPLSGETKLRKDESSSDSATAYTTPSNAGTWSTSYQCYAFGDLDCTASTLGACVAKRGNGCVWTKTLAMETSSCDDATTEGDCGTGCKWHTYSTLTSANTASGLVYSSPVLEKCRSISENQNVIDGDDHETSDFLECGHDGTTLVEPYSEQGFDVLDNQDGMDGQCAGWNTVRCAFTGVSATRQTATTKTGTGFATTGGSCKVTNSDLYNANPTADAGGAQQLPTADQTAFENDYIVTYGYKDTVGNIAAPVTRRVVVVDTVAPTLTLTGDCVIQNSAGAHYNTSAAAGTIAENAGSSGLFDHDGIARFFSHRDDCDRNVHTVVTLHTGGCTWASAATTTGNCHGTATSGAAGKLGCEASAAGTNCFLGVFKWNGVETEQSAADTTKFVDQMGATKTIYHQEFHEYIAGTYAVQYTTKDASGHEVTACRKIQNVDHTYPIIQILGSDQMTLEATHQGNYIDDGATCSDQVDGVISQNVEVSGDVVNLSKVGTYTITYNCKDSANNAAPAAQRTVVVAQTSCPKCTIHGSTTANPGGNVVHEASFPYSDAGAACSDVIDGDVTTLCFTASYNGGAGAPDGVVAAGTVAANGQFDGGADWAGKGYCDGGSGCAAKGRTACVGTKGDGSTCKWNQYSPCATSGHGTTDDNLIADVGTAGSTNSGAQIGTYFITYRARNTVGLYNDGTNCRGGAAVYVRTVTVKDTLRPVITLKYDKDGAGGNAPVAVAQGALEPSTSTTTDLTITDTLSDKKYPSVTGTAYSTQGNFDDSYGGNHETSHLMAEESTSSVNGWVIGAIASAVAGLALLGYSTRRTAVATSVPV